MGSGSIRIHSSDIRRGCLTCWDSLRKRHGSALVSLEPLIRNTPWWFAFGIDRLIMALSGKEPEMTAF